MLYKGDILKKYFKYQKYKSKYLLLKKQLLLLGGALALEDITEDIQNTSYKKIKIYLDILIRKANNISRTGPNEEIKKLINELRITQNTDSLVTQLRKSEIYVNLSHKRISNNYSELKTLWSILTSQQKTDILANCCHNIKKKIISEISPSSSLLKSNVPVIINKSSIAQGEISSIVVKIKNFFVLHYTQDKFPSLKDDFNEAMKLDDVKVIDPKTIIGINNNSILNLFKALPKAKQIEILGFIDSPANISSADLDSSKLDCKFIEQLKKETCAICLEFLYIDHDNGNSKIFGYTTCKHFFHKECIDNLININRGNSFCPNCRTVLAINPLTLCSYS